MYSFIHICTSLRIYIIAVFTDSSFDYKKLRFQKPCSQILAKGHYLCRNIKGRHISGILDSTGTMLLQHIILTAGQNARVIRFVVATLS